MGLQIDIDARVTVELRRESFTLYVEGNEPTEYDYRDVGAIRSAVFAVEKSDRYLDDHQRRLALWAEETP